MKKFKVVVNGETFEVEIEEVGGSPATAPSTPAANAVASAPKASAPQPEAPKPAAPKPAAPKPAPTGAANEVTSPLPGTVLNISAKEGQTVNSGDVVLIIEAMKMENEIVAPEGGTIISIPVKKGDSVQAGDLLFTLG
ncbi:acetyl-CoA carboxylase biotin carboxyl carrier protein subunit [Candidatus Formimonas warabiya]|uniref:Acetyl-CoA carboxylase biotin carboxyl carrier protein subunit n=2 Tax=Formimonas warabiya TaxID=1761012 RepID=A0A3G1KPF9_FORW1|nr:biotin/lipoyl-containing protein [Candidatus Formimonas warabiya]ATW24351.1 acetyl-CoA carboxylase biotin carboxyl carrier protein subunit [Candidatus Formimonas warabiya]